MRSEWILGGLLVVALTGSYLTWTSDSGGEEEAATEGAAVYTASAEDLQKLSWKAEKATVVVERRTDGSGPYLWVTVTEQVQKRAPGAAEAPSAAEEPKAEDEPKSEDEVDPEAEEVDPVADPATPAVEYEQKVTEFLGNEAADTLWAAFAPLMAMRELDAAAATEKQAVFGFDTPTATLEVLRKSGPLVLTVGGETYGAKDRYLQAEGKVWLVADATVRPIQYGKTRLMERRLQPLDEAAMDRVNVSYPGGEVQFVQQNKDDRAAAYWSRGTGTEKAELESTWLGKLFRLRVQAYEKPADDVTLTPRFSFTVAGTDGTHTVEVLEGGDQFWARSTFSRTVVKLTKSVAADAVADLDAIVQGSTEPAPAP